MKRKLKYILFTTLLLISALIIFYADLISYGTRQGIGQFEVLWNARPAEDMLVDSSFPDSLKSRLRLVSALKKYAVQELGMKGTDNYTTVFDQKGQDILWNVTACKPYEFSPYRWHFPVVGSVSYKGFFNLELAKEEARELKENGYDVRIRPVGAWSTLGWFQDPILSNMLNRSENQLAETIFHELTHTTVFLPDSVEFNENLASFVAQNATYKYLADKYGQKSKEVRWYGNELDDQKKYHEHFLTGKRKLEELYDSFSVEDDTSMMNRKKQELIGRIVDNYDTITFKNKRYRKIWENRTLPNNAFFMYFARYYETPVAIYELFKEADHDVRKFLQKLKEMNN